MTEIRKPTQPEDLFHQEIIEDPNSYAVFVTDNTANYAALASGGIVSSCIEQITGSNSLDFEAWIKRLVYYPDAKRKAFILLFDTETNEGHALQNTAAKELRSMGITAVVPESDIIQPGNINEALTLGGSAIFRKLTEYQEQIARAQMPRPDRAADYLKNNFAQELKEFQQGIGKRTGFDELDRKTGGIFPALYVLGGISSVGKTTFAHQLADQIARAGEDVLYFSLEQSRLEMISKSIARETAKLTSRERLTSLQIRQGQRNDSSTKAQEKYLEQIADRLSIIEGGFNTTISEISNYIRAYVEKNKCRPIVFIDYLQIIQPAPDKNGRKPTDQRAITDLNVTTLKRISRKYKLPIFVISSLNRTNYLTEIDFESFKESGGIEYTADIVYGLQLSVIHEDLFDKQNKINEKRARIKEAKAELPRQVELVCLKNRYGVSGFTVNFNYDPRYDLFTEA